MSLKIRMVTFVVLCVFFSSYLDAAEIPALLKQTGESALKGDADAQYLMGCHHILKGAKGL